MGLAGGDDHVDEELLDEVLMLLDDEPSDGLLRACDMFRSGIPERLLAVDSALEGGRFEDAARVAHSLRGSAGAFGARRLRALGDQLEGLCKAGDGPAAIALLAEMWEEFEVFRDILDDRLAEISARRAYAHSDEG